MTVYSDIAAQTMRDTVHTRVQRDREREREREDAPTPVGSSTCDQCGGIIFPNPSMSGNRFQPCTTCFPTKEIGEASVVDRDSTRRSVARADSQKTFASMTPCKECGDSAPRRYVVGERCVVCVAAAIDNGEYEDTAPVGHPIADANRANVAPKVNRYAAPDWPCPSCGGTTRYVKYNTCVTCSNRKKKTTQFNNTQSQGAAA